MIQISIDGISVDINKINYIHIVEVSDEEIAYVTIDMHKYGTINLVTENFEEFEKWDSFLDIGSVRGTRKELEEEGEILKEMI